MSISFRSRIWRIILRGMFKNQPRSIEELRANGAKSAKFMGGLPKGSHSEQIDIAGTTAEWIIPANARPAKIILYLHGGGYVTGSIESHRMLCGLLANTTQTTVLLPEYRLAPEHPFPAALDDSLKVFRWLVAQGHAAEDITICGDSAGGGLSLATVLALRDEGASLPAAVVCLSPWVDLTLTGESHLSKDKVDPILRTETLREWAQCYTIESNLTDPLVSPVYANFRGFPPMLIMVGTDEILLDDSVLLAEKAKADGVKVEFNIWSGMWHVWPVFGEMIPESQMAFKEIERFLSKL